MKLRKIEKIAREMMDEHSLYDYKFEWMNAVRTFGNCNGHRKIIRLSIPLTKYETNNERIINTILHEIAHAIEFLISDKNTYITGSGIDINGGQFLSG